MIKCSLLLSHAHAKIHGITSLSREQQQQHEFATTDIDVDADGGGCERIFFPYRSTLIKFPPALHRSTLPTTTYRDVYQLPCEKKKSEEFLVCV
jgi:hypothetical protein